MFIPNFKQRIHWLGVGQEVVDEQCANILFPHWGYELKKYPRPEIVNMAKEFCIRVDAILGHHSHTVQPFTVERVGDKDRLIAYSLGYFCSNIPIRAYRYGIIAKIEVGSALSGDYLIGNVEWRFIEPSVPMIVRHLPLEKLV